MHALMHRSCGSRTTSSIALGVQRPGVMVSRGHPCSIRERWNEITTQPGEMRRHLPGTIWSRNATSNVGVFCIKTGRLEQAPARASETLQPSTSSWLLLFRSPPLHYFCWPRASSICHHHHHDRYGLSFYSPPPSLAPRISAISCHHLVSHAEDH